MAKSGIQGITVKIGGDTTELGKALSDAQKQSKSLQTELKGVNTLLANEKGVKNTELLKQKQNLLTKSIDESKKKLEALKEVQSKVDSGEIKMSEEEYRNLQREIASTTDKISALKKEQQEFGSVAKQTLDSVGDQFQKVGSNVENAGKKMAGISAGAGAIVAGSVSAFNEINDGLAIIANGTGATGDKLDGLRDVAKNVYGSMNTDMNTVGQAVSGLNTRFDFQGEELQGASEAFIQYAEINNVDVSTAISSVARYMGDAGIEAENYGEVLDALTSASQASGISVDKLAEQCTNYGAPMRALGFTTQESIAIFAGWEKAGVNTTIAFSGMKNAISKWSAEGKDAKEEFKKTLQTIQEAPDIATATTLSIEAFGKKAGPDLADAIQGGRFSYEEFMAILENSNDTVSTTFDNTQTETDKAKIALNQLKLVGSDLGSSIMTTLTPVIEKLSEGIKKLSEWFNGLSPEMRQTIAVSLLVVTALAPLLILVGKLITAVGTIIKVIGLIATPAGLVIAVIGALIAVGVLLYKNWDTIKEKAGELMGSMSEKWESIKANTSEAWNNIKTSISTSWESAKSSVSSGVESLTSTMSGKWESIKTTAGEKWEEIKSNITDKITSAKDTVHDMIETMKGFFNFSWSLPSIKLPHFSVSGSPNPFDWFTQGVPTLSIEWYKKAMNKALMFTSPTVLPTSDGLKGFGDAGAELVIGNNTLMSMISDAMSAQNDTGAVVSKLEQIERKLSRLSIVLDSGELVGGILDPLDNAMGNKLGKLERGW